MKEIYIYIYYIINMKYNTIFKLKNKCNLQSKYRNKIKN